MDVMAKPLMTMLKKDMVLKWTGEGKDGFDQIKQATIQAPTMVSPNYDKYFILYTLGGEENILVVLTYLNDDGLERALPFLGRA